MTDFLYLDTARLGRPSPRTVRSATDALALAAEEGGSAYFDRFLRGGLADCPAWMQSRYPGLQSWRGISALKADLRTLVGGPPDLPVLLANRSSELMRYAARLLFMRCRTVLTCDLGWPAYQAILEQEAVAASGQVVVVPLKDKVLGNQMSAGEVVEELTAAYVGQKCDGMFFPAVSNHGVKLPIQQVVRRIEAAGEIRFAVVDGAQEFCHTAAELANDYCDLYLTGCHKWLAGHHPMGVGFYGRRRSRAFVETLLARLAAGGMMEDPLLRFSERIEAGWAGGYTETVSLAGLFTCQTAVAEACEFGIHTSDLTARLQTRATVAEIAVESGWQPVNVDPTMQSAILLVRSDRHAARWTEPAELRAAFRERGVGLTIYENGMARLSMPTAQLTTNELHLVRAAFVSVLPD